MVEPRSTDQNSEGDVPPALKMLASLITPSTALLAAKVTAGAQTEDAGAVLPRATFEPFMLKTCTS